MPKKIETIDEKQVEFLASRFWKNTEIAAFFGCDEGTIRKRFSDAITKGKELGKGSLRDAQIKLALAGNATMLIWLGKQYLEQTEKYEITNDELINNTLEFKDIPSNGKGLHRFERFIHR
jgi:hypothetical protein